MSRAPTDPDAKLDARSAAVNRSRRWEKHLPLAWRFSRRRGEAFAKGINADVRIDRSRGRSARIATNARVTGSRRTATSTGPPSSDDPDPDPDPSDQLRSIHPHDNLTCPLCCYRRAVEVRS